MKMIKDIKNPSDVIEAMADPVNKALLELERQERVDIVKSKANTLAGRIFKYIDKLVKERSK